MERQFEILVVGRMNGDIILDPDRVKVRFAEDGVILSSSGTEAKIPTDSAPSKENDKVTSLIELDPFIASLPKESYSRSIGGGGANSLLATAGYLMNKSPNLGATLLTPSKQYLKIGNDVFDLGDELDANYNVNHHFMNFTDLNYSIVTGGENKLIIRNRPRGTQAFSLRREHKGTILQYINPSDGVLINALNDGDMTKFIAESIYDENYDYYKTQEALEGKDAAKMVHEESFITRPKHRKLVTVVTAAKNMSRDTIVSKVMPYSSIIMNETDAIKIFYGSDTEHSTRGNDASRLEMMLTTMFQMRNGIRTPRGIMRKIGDTNNNIYITLGSKGHLVCLENKVYHLQVEDEVSRAVNKAIQENKSSTSGAGDAFAAGIAYQETRGEAGNHIMTAAVANTTVFNFLGMIDPTHETQIRQVAEYDLEDFKKAA